MSYKFRISREDIEKFQKSDYIEFVVYNKVVYLVSESVTDLCICTCELLYNTEEEGAKQIRVPSDIIKLMFDGFAEVTINESDVYFKFSNLQQQLSYTYKCGRFASFLDLTMYAKLIRDVANCPNELLTSINQLVTVGSKLSKDITISEGKAYFTFKNSFVFTGTTSSDVSCDAKRFKSIIGSASTVKYIGNFIFSRLSSNVVLFSKKTRPSLVNDIDFVVNKKFLELFSVEMKNVLPILGGFRFNDTTSIKLNLTQGMLTFNDGSITIDVPVVVVKLNGVDNIDDLLSPSATEELDTIINIPFWVIDKVMNTSEIRIGLGKNVVRFGFRGLNVMVPR